MIYLYLSGGPPQHETFDPKPGAPKEVRGAFEPIHTNIPGIQFSELLPRTAGMADKLAVCRAMSTNDNTHSTSGYWVLTGFPYRGTNARTLQPTDWPNLGSVVKLLKPSEGIPFSFAWLPEPIVANPGVLISGQSGGFLGPHTNPERFTCDPQTPGDCRAALPCWPRSIDTSTSWRVLTDAVNSTGIVARPLGF